MFDVDKLRDNNAIFWIFQFPEMRKVAKSCGWALGVHGSVVHDLDLMAMPWIEEHTTADELANRLSKIVTNQEPQIHKSKPGDKPNGRIVYTIIAGPSYIDMNVIETSEVSDVLRDAKQLLKNCDDCLKECDEMKKGVEFLNKEYESNKRYFREEPGRVTTKDIIKTSFEFGWASKRQYDYDNK